MQERNYWFPAKRYGWGWGPPCSWQGWAVLLVFIVAQAGAVLRYMPLQPLRFGIATALLVGALMLICLVKGERPGWRWGNHDR